MAKRLRINQYIHAASVRLIDEKLEQIGVMPLQDALQRAKEASLDLVEVSPDADPPVCKIMDYGKFQYRQKKIDKKHKQQQQVHELKGIRLSIRTGDHDLLVKAKQAEKFLKAGHSLKVVLLFRGREMAHREMAQAKLVRFQEELRDISKPEGEVKSQGYTMTMILHPLT